MAPVDSIGVDAPVNRTAQLIGTTVTAVIGGVDVVGDAHSLSPRACLVADPGTDQWMVRLTLLALLTAVLSITVIWTAARLAGIGGQTARAKVVEGAVQAA